MSMDSKDDPPLDIETPQLEFVKTPPQQEKPKLPEPTEEDLAKPEMCEWCKKGFENIQGKKSHLNHCDLNPANMYAKELKEVYQQDMVRFLLPSKSSKKFFDPDLMAWVDSMTIKFPDGYVLYSIIAMDKAYQTSPHVSQKSSFMEVWLIKEDKVITDGKEAKK